MKKQDIKNFDPYQNAIKITLAIKDNSNNTISSWAKKYFPHLLPIYGVLSVLTMIQNRKNET